jgi:NarL family two-component system response regulator LiaR
MSKIRVLLADDHSLFREGLANIMNAQPDFEVVGEAGDGLEVLVKARELAPDLVVMDISMPGCDGVEATQQIMSEFPDMTIVMLTVRDEDEKLFEAIKSGARGYLLKSISSRELVSMLRRAVSGDAAISPALGGRMLEEFRRLARQEHFSPDERDRRCPQHQHPHGQEPHAQYPGQAAHGAPPRGSSVRAPRGIDLLGPGPES